MGHLRDEIMSGRACVAVHGLGYIGASSASFLRARGITVYGIDPDAAKVMAARRGDCPVPALAPWLAAAGAPFRAIDAHTDLAKGAAVPIAVHHVCVPTEAEGAASDAALHACVDGIAASDPSALVVIESTVAPPYLDRIGCAHPVLRVVVAPRRDWFDAPDKHMGSLPRVVGCDEPDVLADVVDYLRLVCDDVRPVADARVAALTKVVENSLRHVELAYANELAAQIGDRYDVRRILELAATKWNIGLFRPSIGLGGYCIPLAPKYLQLLGVPLAMTEAAVRASVAHIDRVVAFLSGFTRVDFWSVAYKATAPFAPSSPAVWIAERLRAGGCHVRVFATADGEVAWAETARVDIARWPEDAGGEALVIPVAHADALALNDAAACMTVAKYRLVVDNEDALRRVSGSVWKHGGTSVRVPGTLGWLSP